mgnify:CR=1 FL=1
MNFNFKQTLQDKIGNLMFSGEKPKQRKCSYQKLTIIIYFLFHDPTLWLSHHSVKLLILEIQTL